MRTLLVVEDEPMLRAALVRGLSAIDGLTVLSAHSVAAACALAVASPPSMLVSDVNLPDGLGFEVHEFLLSAGLDVPTVFMTAAAGALARERTRARVLQKPFALRDLRDLVLRALDLDAPRSSQRAAAED